MLTFSVKNAARRRACRRASHLKNDLCAVGQLEFEVRANVSKDANKAVALYEFLTFLSLHDAYNESLKQAMLSPTPFEATLLATNTATQSG